MQEEEGESQFSSLPCEVAASLQALSAVIWHDDAQQGIVHDMDVSKLAQWCAARLRKTSLQVVDATGQQQEMQLLRSILLTLGGTSKLLKSEHVCSILVANEKIFSYLMQKNSGLEMETISMVLLCLRAMQTDGGSCCQHEPHSQRILLQKRLPFAFLRVLLTSITGMVSEGSTEERAVGIAGVAQLYSNEDDEWERVPDDPDVAAAQKAYASSLAECSQGALTILQQALVDRAWPCSWRLHLPALLASLLSSSIYGEELASQEWHLMVQITAVGVGKRAHIRSEIYIAMVSLDLKAWNDFYCCLPL
jgi:hypothetical protein